MILAQVMFGPYGHNDFWWVGGLFGLLIVIAVVVGVVLVVRQFLERPPTRYAPPPPPAPLSRAVEELDLRYARGEIDRAEYMQRRTDLVHGPLAHGGPAGATPPAPPASPAPGAPPPA